MSDEASAYDVWSYDRTRYPAVGRIRLSIVNIHIYSVEKKSYQT